MRTAATNKKIRELITMVREERLVPRPEFQRRLVWKIEDKNLFLDTILRGFPFPEIYVADGEIDIDTGGGTQLLVDGLQRISTITQYFDGDPDLKLVSVPPYADLQPEQKSAFLQYDVAVRDLGSIPMEVIVEVFKRINATDYSLNDIEVNNAVYRGALKEFASRLSEDHFFVRNRVFNVLDIRRMGDLRFSLSIVIALLAGYTNRDDMFELMLDLYNDSFPPEDDIASALQAVFGFIDECGFPRSCRIWRKADLYSAIVELYRIFTDSPGTLQPSEAVERLGMFYEQVEHSGLGGETAPSIYYKAALQASNDRGNRIRRGVIIEGVLEGAAEEVILDRLREQGWIDSRTEQRNLT